VSSLAPPAPGDSVRPRGLTGASGRPLNFTVSRCEVPVQHSALSSMHTSRLVVVLLLAP